MESPFNRADWELLECRNNFNLLRHRKSPRVVEEYIIENVSEEEKLSWARRLRIKHENVLGVLGCELFSNLVGDGRLSMRVYLESTIQRLS